MSSTQKIIFVCCCFFMIVLSGCNQKAQQFHDVQGNVINLNEYQGKWLIVNYWASWCKPCYEEIPELNALYAAHKDKDIVIIGVNYEQIPTETLKRLTDKMGIKFPILTTDPARQLGIKEVGSLPATFIFEPGGKLAESLLGKQTRQSLEEAIEAAKDACGDHQHAKKRHLFF